MTSRSTFTLRRERGVGIVTAIFLLVVLAGLGVAMVGLYTTQQASSNLDLQGARAYQAARAGLEWGLFQQTRNGQCTASAKVAMPDGTTLTGFNVVVTCKKTGTAPAPNFRLTAVACNIADSEGNCNCDATVNPNSCKPSSNPETVNRKIEAQL